MTFGIGAAGILGLAFEQLSPPVQNTPTTTGTGGTLGAGLLYRYYVTAINANGETTVSNEQSVTTGGGSTNKNTVNWVTVSGATGFKIYRTAAGGASGTELLLTTVGLVTSFDDTGALTPSGALPTMNTAANPNVYVAPTKFIPFTSESITIIEDTVFRRPIRQSADIIGAVPGNYHPEGDVEMEALEDIVPYFLMASRVSMTPSGTTPNFTYTFTPTAAGVPVKTLSITIVRNNVVFGFTGMVTSSFGFGIDSGLLTFKTSMKGRDEATQSVPTPTWPTSTPFGAGMYSVEVPTGSPVLDTDTFEWMVEDNADVQFRLKNTSRGAQYINYGERNSTMTFERDFENRTDFDAFKAVTSQSVTITATRTANNSISLLAPASIKDTFEVSNSGQGDLVRASLAYQNVIDGTGKSWQIVIKTQEVIT